MISKYKSRLTVQNLLLLSTISVFGLVFFRVIYTYSFKNAYLAWNLFLAIIPYLLVRIIVKKELNITRYVFWLLVALWLLFLPNSPYIITDLVHLQYNHSVPIWYDYMKLFLAAFTGIFWGHLSLIQLEYYIEKKFQIPYKYYLVFILFLLTSYGVFIGRFLRWNSWDIFIQPLNVIISLKSNICLETIAFVLLFTFIQFFSYLLIKVLIRNNI